MKKRLISLALILSILILSILIPLSGPAQACPIPPICHIRSHIPPAGPDPPPVKTMEQTIPPTVVEPDPLIQLMMEEVVSTTVTNYDGGLSGEWPVWVGGEWYTITTRDTYSGEPIQKATQYVGEHMQGLGLDVEYHVWEGPTYPNVIGELPGLINPDDIYIICGHLDAVPGSPGADDNASGSVAVMVAADILTQYHWGCTLRFALWTGEEYGLLGSYAYAQRASQNGENILGVLNLDMIGWNTPESSPDIDLYYSPDMTPTLAMAELFADVVDVYNVNLIPEVLPDQWGGSDHFAFWYYGYPAILGIEDGEDFNPYYHSPDDLLAHLDVAYFTEFVRASLGTFAHMTGCLIPSGIGHLDGHVTAANGGAPIAGATIVARDEEARTYTATTDETGYYTRTLIAGSYTLTVSAYGYISETVSGVDILTDTVTTQDLALADAPTYTISGIVTETGSGAPLLAQVDFLGAPVTVSTDPDSGFYQATVAQGPYTMRVTADHHRPEERPILVRQDQTQHFALDRRPCILLVDDDQGDPEVGHYYTETLEGLGVDYAVWDLASQGDPQVDDMAGYPIAVWFTGFPWQNTLTHDNQDVIASYLDAGGNLLLSSEDYLYDLGVDAFGQDYLGILSFEGESLDIDPVGTAGDPIGDGLGPYTLTIPPAWPWLYTDDLTAVQGSPFRWASTGMGNSARYEGENFKSLFLAWPLEGLADLEDRMEVMARAVDWFGGCCSPVQAVHLSWQPVTPTVGSPVTFTAAASGTEPITFTWAWGDGAVGEGRVVTHTYAQASTYTVTLTATNGCSEGTATRSIPVAPIVRRVYLPLAMRRYSSP